MTSRAGAPPILPLLRRAAVLTGQAVRSAAHLAGRLAAACLRCGGPTPARLLGEELARLCERLGPTFLKAAQVLSSRPDLLPPAVVGPLARLQDRVAPFDSRRIPALLAAAFGRPMEEVFAAFDPLPVASASIAHVHRARLHDGREVAVKVRRPGAVERVAADFHLLRTLARWLARWPPLRPVPLLELVAEIEAPIRAQLDFRAEAANNRRLRANFAAVEHVRIPALVEELCTGSVLTMEYLPDLVRVGADDLPAGRRRQVALAGLRALYKMIFLDGFIHADLHPGNVLVGRDGELVLLDTGLMARLGEADLEEFVLFFFGLANNRGRVCARVVYETATYRAPDCDRAGFEASMVELIERHSALKSHEFEVALFAAQLIDLQRRYGIRGSTKFIMAILAMVVFDGICKQLYPDCDFQREARGYLIAAKYRRYRAAAV